MAKTLKCVILQLSEGPDSSGPGVLEKAVAKYILGDSDDPSFQSPVKFKEVTTPDFSLSAEDFYGTVVASIREDERIA